MLHQRVADRLAHRRRQRVVSKARNRKSNTDCPCFSGLRYAQCCEPMHRSMNAPTAVALMRSRYSAFALGLGDYLVDTLASDHQDRSMPRAELVLALRRAKDRQRFMGLTILEATDDEVRFFAKVFERGQDRSFTELSKFVREDGQWRYASGELID